jgi:hypothetical protein
LQLECVEIIGQPFQSFRYFRVPLCLGDEDAVEPLFCLALVLLGSEGIVALSDDGRLDVVDKLAPQHVSGHESGDTQRQPEKEKDTGRAH